MVSLRFGTVVGFKYADDGKLQSLHVRPALQHLNNRRIVTSGSKSTEVVVGNGVDKRSSEKFSVMQKQHSLILKLKNYIF